MNTNSNKQTRRLTESQFQEHVAYLVAETLIREGFINEADMDEGTWDYFRSAGQRAKNAVTNAGRAVGRRVGQAVTNAGQAVGRVAQKVGNAVQGEYDKFQQSREYGRQEKEANKNVALINKVIQQVDGLLQQLVSNGQMKKRAYTSVMNGLKAAVRSQEAAATNARNSSRTLNGLE